MSELFQGYGLGWRPDLPDVRDLTFQSSNIPAKLKAKGHVKSVKQLLKDVGIENAPKKLATKVDLREWCSPIEDQKEIGSCTAHAGVGLIEYYERKATGKHIDASRLFLYKVTRNLLGWKGDTGAYLRSTMGAMVLFGTPPEKYWPYDTSKYDEEPTAFLYSFAQNSQALSYYRLDPVGTSPSELLTRIKTYLAAQLPCMFGFTVYNSITQADATGKIPFPSSTDSIEGGHAVMAVGYDDTIKIKNTKKGSKETTGAILIRNSWGKTWGDKGYGWLPYDYILNGLADDWWSLISKEWVETDQFGFK